MLEFLRKLICNLVPNKKLRNKVTKHLMPERFQDYKRYGCILDERFQEFKQKSKTIETLVLGTSHAQFSILPFILGQNAFNLGLGASGLLEHYYVLKKILPIIPNVKDLLLAISFYNGATCTVYTQYAYFCPFWKKYFDIPYDFSLNKKYNLNEIYKRIQKMKIKKNIKTVNGFDFINIYYGYQSSPVEIKEAVAKHIHLLETFNNQWIYLEKIAALCKQNQIKLHVVITPTRSDYNKVCHDLGYSHKKLYTPLHKICQQLEINVLDFSKGFENDDFYDYVHLNFSGALKLSNRLKEKI